MGPRLVVIGPPGAGKSTIGRLSADRLGVAFADSDDAVEQGAGRSIADIFVDDGEAAFRDLERAAVVDLLSTAQGVLALGGGAVLDPRTEADLRGHAVVFLDVGIADAAKRVGFATSRPLLAINPRAQWTALMTPRRPIYERVATFRVDTAGREPGDVVDEVVEQLLRHEGGS